MKRTIYIVLVWTAVLTACKREIAYNGEYQDPGLVVQTELAEGGNTVDCVVTRSAFFLDPPQEPVWYPSQGVVLTVERDNGEVVVMPDTELTTDNHVFHVPVATPLQADERVTVRASHPDYPEAYGSDVVVPMPEVEVVSCVWDSVYDRCRVCLKFAGNAAFDGVMGVKARLDYRMARQLKSGEMKYEPYYSNYIVSTDIAFMGMDNANSTEEGFNSFSELFMKSIDVRDKEVEFFIQATYRSSPPSRIAEPVEAKISIVAHSSDSYLYWRSIYNYFDALGSSDYDLGSVFSSMFGVEETAQIYSNVRNGYGAVVGTSVKSVTITFNDNN